MPGVLDQGRCRELYLDWHTVKELDKQYMRAQLARAGTRDQSHRIDEISVGKGHDYRIVVSDLIRRRPIWFGGNDRSEASMAAFYAFLGEKNSKGIRLAVMDMWKPFRKAPVRTPPGGDPVRQVSRDAPPGRGARHGAQGGVRATQGQGASVHQGQKYTLLSHQENLSTEGRQALKTLLAANKRLNTAYLLKESSGNCGTTDASRGRGASSRTGAPR